MGSNPRRGNGTIRVLFAIPGMGTGGSERVLRTLLQHLDRSRFEPHLALLSNTNVRNLPDEIVRHHLENLPPDIQVHDLGVTRARYAVLPIARLCRRLRAQVILSMSAHLSSAVLLGRALLLPDVRVLAREGTNIVSPEFTTNALRRFWYKHLYRRANRIICQSDSMRQDMIETFGITPEKAIRIYNPVDIDSMNRLADPNPFAAGGPNLVVVSRLFPNKGINLLLQSLPLIRAAVPTAELHIIGWGDCEPCLRAQTQSLGLDSCVHFVGFRCNPYPFLKHAHLVLLASRNEGLPNVALEALAFGTPVVSTNCCGGLTEIAATTTRLRVTADFTPESIATEVIAALARPQKSVIAEPEFVARFGLRAVVAAYQDLIHHTIGGQDLISEQATSASLRRTTQHEN